MVTEADPQLSPVGGGGEGVAGGVVMMVLDNGVKVNYKQCESESQRAHLRSQPLKHAPHPLRPKLRVVSRREDG